MGTAPAAIAVLAAGGAGAIAARNPFRTGAWPTCPFHAATGLNCPFCGGTRAVYAILHGHPALMFATNPLLPVLAVFAVWAWLSWLTQLDLIPYRIPTLAATTWARIGLPALLGAFWVARNLPGLGFLSPHGHL